MNIVILDGYTLNPGDISWHPIESIDATTIYARTAPDEILSRSKDADMILVNKVKLTEDIIKQLPKLKYIGILATGVNNIDLKACKKAGITVCNVPSYGPSAVAQHVFALLTTICNRVGAYSDNIEEWCQSPDFSYWHHDIIELSGLTLGLIGFGEIAKKVARIANAMDMRVISYKPKPITSSLAEFVSLDILFSQSDVVSLHCPLTDETKEIINEAHLSKMKDSVILINTARGSLVDEQALADALNNGRIAACGLDVLSSEPPAPENPLLTAKNCYITPHIAWASIKARCNLLRIASENIRAFLANKPQNQVT